MDTSIERCIYDRLAAGGRPGLSSIGVYECLAAGGRPGLFMETGPDTVHDRRKKTTDETIKKNIYTDIPADTKRKNQTIEPLRPLLLGID
jgi:hypothetical protein